MALSTPLESVADVYAALSRERRRQDMKWEALASRVGVKYQSLQAFEGGKAHPTLATLRRWVKALGMGPEIVDQYTELRALAEIDRVLVGLDVDQESRSAVRVLIRGVLRRTPGARLQRGKAAVSGS